MKKKKLKRQGKIGIVVFLILLIIVIGIVLYVKKDDINTYLLVKNSGYSKDTINIIKKNKVNTDILKKEYSKTLDKFATTKYFNKKYVNEYIKIKYVDKEDFAKVVNELLDLGYSSDDINNLYKKLSDNSLKIIVSNKHIDNLVKLISLDYYKDEYLSRYLKYMNSNTNLSVENIVTYVNAGLDNPFYTNTIDVKDPDDIAMIVNKYYKLSNKYVPKDLEVINSKYQWAGRSNRLRKEARIAFEEMCAAAAKENIYIYAGSGYRSFNYQSGLYNAYVKRDGFKAAETYSARPGFSEHQTGLAMDVTNKREFIGKNSREYPWLINNSYKYGFILRYPEGMDSITGYKYEEWHYRYVGKELAKKVYDSKLTYDEYVARYK